MRVLLIIAHDIIPGSVIPQYFLRELVRIFLFFLLNS